MSRADEDAAGGTGAVGAPTSAEGGGDRDAPDGTDLEPRHARLPSSVGLFSDDEFLVDLRDLKRDRKIGSGAFATVYAGTYRSQPVAIKEQAISSTEPDAEKYLRSELSMLRSLRHPHLLEYIGAALVPQRGADGSLGLGGSGAGLRGRKVLVVTKLIDCGELREVLARAEVALGWKLRVKIAMDVISAICFVHSNNVVHRDIKTSNILIDRDWNAVLCDLGFARRVDSSAAMTICGTVEFMAPEVLFGEIYDGKADVFSFGLVLVELITRRVPGEAGFLMREPRSNFRLSEDDIRAGGAELRLRTV